MSLIGSSPGSKPKTIEAHQVAEIADLTDQQWVAATSDRFLWRFIDFWLLFAIALWIFQYETKPAIPYPPYFMVTAGILARFAARAGHMRLARYLFLLPLCIGVIVASLLVNGVRTPVLASMPMLVLLTGWMLGRRAMKILIALFALFVAWLWLAEAQGWLVLGFALRSPEVWSTVWVSTTTLTGIVVWSLVANYEANFGKEKELRLQLADALGRAEAANQELVEALDFNATIILDSPLAMGVYDASGQCILANDAYGWLVGGTREALCTQNFHNIVAWQKSGPLDDCLEALANQVPQRREVHLFSSFGKEIWVEYSIIPTQLKGEKHLLIQFVDLTERKVNEAKIQQLAFHDPLTNLPNRRLLLDRLGVALPASARHNTYGAILFFDLDNFKALNDTKGHAFGDLLLTEVAKRLLSCVRAEDTVARLGGDEFVVMVEGLSNEHRTAAAETQAVAEKIRDALSEEYLLQDFRHRSTCSIGICMFKGVGITVDELVRRADVAMYKAKHRGRNCIETDIGDAPQALNTASPAEHTLVQLVWKDAFLSGNRLIDQQHQELFQLSNALLDAFVSQRSHDEITMLVAKLLEAVTQHFRDEETILADLQFSGLQEHASKHAALVAKGVELVKSSEANTLSAGQLFQFLAHDVVSLHMLGADREFFPLTCSQNQPEAISPI
ncbi:MAG: diguanylate cyclase domain-containing protein [Burkholderiales bacterium]